MAEVDYSRFYYKREREEERVSPPERGGEKKVRKKRSGKPFLVLLTLIVIIGIVFFSIDFFSNGKLIDSITANLKGNSYEYYFVVNETGGRDLAYAKSLLIKQSGGSGYIIDENNKFLVVLSVYTDKSEAMSVSSKNANTYVYTAGFTSKNTKIFNAADKAVGDICNNLKGLESGATSESDVYGALLSVRGEIIKLKAEILESGTASEINLLDYIIGGIDGLDVGKGTRLNFLSDARYMLSGIIVSMCMLQK